MKEYRNKDIIDNIEEIANSIIKLEPTNDKRENFFPLLIERLHLNTVVEIGVDKGQFSHCLLSKSKLKKFYGIDPWINDFGSDYRPGFFDPNGENRMQEATDRLSEFGDRVELVKNYSAIAAPYFPNDSIDFVYIDGDHSFEGIYTDLYNWVSKVRIGGIVAGHDYKDGPNSGIKDYFGEQLPYRIKSIVDDFCRKYGFKLNAVGPRVPSWWFVRV
jgi:hypothetical protein